MKKYLKFIIFSFIPIISVILFHYFCQYRLTAKHDTVFYIYIYYALVGLVMGFYLKFNFNKKIFMIENIAYMIFFTLVLLYSIGIFIIPYRLFALFSDAFNITAVWIGVFICKIVMMVMGDLFKKNHGPIMFVVSSVMPVLTVVVYDRMQFLVRKFEYEPLTSIDNFCVSYGIYIIFGIIIGLYLYTSYANKKLQLIINVVYAVFFIASKMNHFHIMIFPTFIYQLAYESFEFVTLWIGIFICKIIFIVKDN